MTCISNKPYYIPQNQSGIQLVNSLGTGNEIELFWYQAYIDNPTFKLAYNVYFLESSADGYLLKIYPETLLAANISAQSTIIPITDINSFPPMGIIQVGVELIKYSSKDIPNGTLVMAERGFLNSKITSHDTAVFDGYVNQDPIIRFFVGLEEKNTLINEEETKFNYPNFPYTAVDGYKQITQDLLNTDLSVSDAQQVN